MIALMLIIAIYPNTMASKLLANKEYTRLYQLIGKPPLGDCQLVALIISRAIGGYIIRLIW